MLHEFLQLDIYSEVEKIQNYFIIMPKAIDFLLCSSNIAMEKLLSARKRELIIRTRRKIKVVVTRGKNYFKNWGLFSLFLRLLSVLSLFLFRTGKRENEGNLWFIKTKCFYIAFSTLQQYLRQWITELPKEIEPCNVTTKLFFVCLKYNWS